MHKPRKVIYTAMFGGFDEPHDPIIDLPDWDMLFFTDAKMTANKWEIVNVPRKEEFDDIQASRHYKMFPNLYLKDYDISLWIDASILIRKPIDEFLNFITEDVKMAMYPHTNNWNREFGFMDYWCNDLELLESLKEYFVNDGFDPESTIMNGNVIFREHGSKDVIETMNLWWELFNKFYIKRDQVSLAYAIWKTQLKVNFFDGLYPRGDRNPYFLNIGHKKHHRIK